MAFTATDTIGLQYKYNKAGFSHNPVQYRAKKDEEFSKGDLVFIEDGLANVMDNNDTPDEDKAIVGVAAESKKAKGGDTILVWDNPMNVYEVSFANHTDVDADIGSAADNQITLDYEVATSADCAKGAQIYIYDGPGKGDVRTVTGNTVADPSVITVDEDFTARPTSDSKAIITANEGTTTYEPAKIGSHHAIDSNGKLDVEPLTTKTGYLTVVGMNPERLTADVVISPTKTLLGIGETASS